MIRYWRYREEGMPLAPRMEAVKIYLEHAPMEQPLPQIDSVVDHKGTLCIYSHEKLHKFVLRDLESLWVMFNEYTFQAHLFGENAPYYEAGDES